MDEADSLKAGDGEQGDAPFLEIRTWTVDGAVRQPARSMADALSAWIASGSATAVLAAADEPLAPSWWKRPPVAGLVVTEGARAACLSQARPFGRGGLYSGANTSRLIVEILLRHPEGIHKQDLVEEAVRLSGRAPNGVTLSYALRRYGRRDPLDPNVWTALPPSEVLKAGRSDRRGRVSRSTGVARPQGHAYPANRKAAPPVEVRFDWTPDRVGTLRDLAAEGASAARIAAEIGEGVTRNAVISKARRLGVKIGVQRFLAEVHGGISADTGASATPLPEGGTR